MNKAPWLLPVAMLFACRNVERFSSGSGHYEGDVVGGSFVRSNVELETKLCLTLDTEHLQDTPGRVVSSDGRFGAGTALRPLPQIWHDSLSTLNFGEGRVKNLVYMARASDGDDMTVILSLMEGGDVEARVLRGAPPEDGGVATNVFGVFVLHHADGPCAPP